MGPVSGFAKSVRTMGLWHTLRVAAAQAEDLLFDWRFGVRTALHLSLDNLQVLGEGRAAGSPYEPTPQRTFHLVMRELAIAFEDYVFIDFGSGFGKALLMASHYPFKAIRGVEFAPAMHRIAAENIRNYRNGAMRCRDLASICADAAAFPLPDAQSVYYFANPFNERVMTTVVANIEGSLKRTPRSAYIIYVNPVAARVVDRSSFFERVMSRRDVLWGFHLYRSRPSELDALDSPIP